MKNDYDFFRVLGLLILLIVVGQITQTINIPVINDIANYYHVSTHVVQSMNMCFLFPYGFFQLFWGPLSDRYGRKSIILLGIILFIMGITLSINAFCFEMILFGSFLQGSGIAVAGVMARTIMFDCYKGDDLLKANGIVSMCIIIGPLLAPLIGGYLGYYYGWKSIFIFLGIFSTLVLFFHIVFFRETKKNILDELTVKKSLIAFSLVFKQSSFFFNLVYSVIAMSSVLVLETNLGIIFTSILNVNPITTSLLFIIPLPAFFLGSFLVSGLAGKIPLNKVLFLSILASFISSILTIIFGMLNYISILSILFPSVVIFFSAGVVFPIATTSALENSKNLEGTAGSIFGGVQSLGGAICIGFSSLINIHSQLPVGIILSLLTLLSLMTFYLEHKPMRYFKFIQLKDNYD